MKEKKKGVLSLKFRKSQIGYYILNFIIICIHVIRVQLLDLDGHVTTIYNDSNIYFPDSRFLCKTKTGFQNDNRDWLFTTVLG